MVRKRDRFWDYAEHLNGKFKCKFCDRIFSGGVPRVKSHLSGIKGGGIDICSKVPEDVQVAVSEAVYVANKRARAEACSGKIEETSPKTLISNDGVMLDKLLAKFILLNDVDVNIVMRPSFIDFVNGVAERGSHYKLPHCSVVKTKLVPDLEKEIEKHVAKVKKSWDTTGCTLMSDIWCNKERSFVNIFGYSIKGMVLLNALDIHKDKLTSTLLLEFMCFVTREIGAHNIVQYITNNNARTEGLYEDVPISNYRHVYETKCVAHEIRLLFEDIYNGIEWVRKAFDQARAVFTKIHKQDGILSLKQFTNYCKLKQSSTINFYSSYYMLQSIMGAESELRLLVSSSEWLSLGFEKSESGIEVGGIIRSSEFWSEGKEVLHALKSILQVLHLVDSYGATSGFLYAAVKMADEAIKNICETDEHKYQRLWEIFKLRKSKIIHPIHAAAAFLNPAYMCSEKFILDHAMKQGIDFILEKLVGGEEREKFMDEVLLYRNKVPKLFTCTAMTMLRTSHPCDWWDFCGDVLPVLKKYAIRILSQPCSTSSCRRSLSAFETAQIEKRKPLVPAVMDNYLYLRTNALLMENFNAMKERIGKPVDLEKLDGLPQCTEFINDNFIHDLLNETKVPLSDGKLNCWSASARKDDENEKHLHLHFMTKLPSSLVKGNEVEGERGTPIHVILVNSSTGSVVQSGPSSVLKLTVAVIGGDFDVEAGKNWTGEFIGSNELGGREGKMPLLTGDLSVILDKGMGTLGAITFNDVSSWTRSGKFRLEVKTMLGYCEGIRVHEGTSNAFAVVDGDRWEFCGDVLPVLKKYGIRILSQLCSTSSCRRSLSAFEIAQMDKRKALVPATMMANHLYLRRNALLMENAMKEKIGKPLDLEKLDELPDCTEFINGNFTHDLLNKTRVPSSYGNLPQFLKSIGDRMASVANTMKDGTGSSVDPSSMEIVKQCLLSRSHCQISHMFPAASRSFGNAQKTACSRVDNAVSVPSSTSCLPGYLPLYIELEKLRRWLLSHLQIGTLEDSRLFLLE